jgi:integrase
MTDAVGGCARWIVVLWRAGLRIHEALALAERDLDARRGSLLVRRGKGGAPPRGRDGRVELGAASAVAGRARRAAGRAAVLHHRRPDPRAEVVGRRRPRRVSAARGRGGRQAPVRAHQLRHAHALELAREGVPLNIIQRQLGHASLGTTSIYLQGIDPEEIITAVRTRRAPMMSASAGLPL